MNKFVASALVSSTLAAWQDNSVPVYGTYPGWVVGEGRTGISVEIFLDLMCSDC